MFPAISGSSSSSSSDRSRDLVHQEIRNNRVELQLMIDAQKKLETARMEANILEFDLLRKLSRPENEKLAQLRNQLENEYKLKEKEWKALAEKELEPLKLKSQELKKQKAEERKKILEASEKVVPTAKKPKQSKRKTSESSTEEELRSLTSKKLKVLSLEHMERIPEEQEEDDQVVDSSED
jgi:hypothetical protein